MSSSFLEADQTIKKLKEPGDKPLLYVFDASDTSYGYNLITSLFLCLLHPANWL